MHLKKQMLILIGIISFTPIKACEGPATPATLYKILSIEEWEASKKIGQIQPGSKDTKFIHLATKDQVEQVKKKFWNKKEHIILLLDPSKFEGQLVYEANNPGGDKYYHLYEGKILFNALQKIEFEN